MKKKRKYNYLLTKAEEGELLRKLQTEYLSSCWFSYRDAAKRHGVPISVVARLMRRIKSGLDENLKDQRKDEVVRTLLQIELVIGKELEAFELSKRIRSRCQNCKGFGEEKNGIDECRVCDGKGWIETVKPGDPKHLSVVLKALDQKAKIYAMYPQHKNLTMNQLFLSGETPTGERNPLMGASGEQLLVARRLCLELQSDKSVIDAEFEKENEE